MDVNASSGAALIEEHRALKNRARWFRIIFPLVIILIVVANVWMIVNRVKNIDSDALAGELETRLTKLWPRIEDDLTLVAKKLEPVLQENLAKQSAVLAPRLEKRLEKDVEALKVKVEKDFQTELERSLDEVERRQRQVLVDNIPELAGDKEAQDRVLEAVRVALLKWSMRQLTDTLHEHMVAMEDIRKTLQKSYVAEPGAKADPEEVLAIWLDLMNEAVGGDDTILAPAPPEGAKAPKKKPTPRPAGK